MTFETLTEGIAVAVIVILTDTPESAVLRIPGRTHHGLPDQRVQTPTLSVLVA